MEKAGEEVAIMAPLRHVHTCDVGRNFRPSTLAFMLSSGMILTI